MLVPAPSANRRLPAALAGLALALVLTGWLATASANAAPKPPYTVAGQNTTVPAGSSGHSFVFKFTALGSENSNLSVTVPTSAGFTPPQNSQPGSLGYVRVLPDTCKAAAVVGVADARTITVSAKCKKGNSFFSVLRGRGGPAGLG